MAGLWEGGELFGMAWRFRDWFITRPRKPHPGSALAEPALFHGGVVKEWNESLAALGTATRAREAAQPNLTAL